MDRNPPETSRGARRDRWARLVALAAVVGAVSAALPLLHTWLQLKLSGRLDRWLLEAAPWCLLLAFATIAARRPSRPIVLPAPPDWRDILAASACVAVGVLLFTLPDLIWWRATGQLSWVSDPDDLLYLAVGSQAYHNHPFHLSDPSRPEGGLPLYSWLPCVPGILLAKLLGLGPVGIGLAWRILAGAGIPLGWYLLLRRYLGPAPLTAAVVVLLTSDVGAMFGMPLVRQAELVSRFVRGDAGWLQGTFRPPGMQWRVTTPGEIFPFYAACLALLLRARAAPDRRRLAAAGVAFGLLFHVYFYYWTAVGLGLLLGWLLDAGRRRVYLHVGWIGLLVGLPSLVAGLRMRGGAADALSRFDLFVPVPRLGSFTLSISETGLLVVCLFWIWSRRRDLFPVAVIAAAGWALINQTLLTGLAIQNDHWGLHIVGPTSTLMVVLTVLGGLTRLDGRPRRLALTALGLVCGLDVGAGFLLRSLEATSADGSRKQIANLFLYRSQRRLPRAIGLAPNAVVAGDETFVTWSMILENQRMLFSTFLTRHSLTISNDEWNERTALNGYLRGQGRDEFEREQHARLTHDWWGPWSRDPRQMAELLARRMAAYDSVVADPRRALDRFGVRYVGLRGRSSPPDGASRGWRLLEAGRRWWIWERRPGLTAPSRMAGDPRRSAPAPVRAAP